MHTCTRVWGEWNRSKDTFIEQKHRDERKFCLSACNHWHMNTECPCASSYLRSSAARLLLSTRKLLQMHQWCGFGLFCKASY